MAYTDNANQKNPTSATANGTAKYVQSFDEITINSETPATADPWVPRGSPKRDARVSSVGEPKLQQHFDERQNVRAQPKTLFRDTPQSAKDQQDKRPDWLYKYRSEAGEDL